MTLTIQAQSQRAQHNRKNLKWVPKGKEVSREIHHKKALSLDMCKGEEACLTNTPGWIL